MDYSHMSPDAELLQHYLETRSEAAFAAVVERFLPLVFGAALRQVGGDPHRAREVAQSVFILFARKAADLRRHPSPVGWLHTATRNTASKLMRAEIRRARYERAAAGEAVLESNGGETEPRADWERLQPVIDEALHALREDDRTAVLLRFFCQRSFGEIGAQLGLGENAARMRVDRALDRLRERLRRRGIASTGAALSLVLSTHAAQPMPIGLAATIASQTALAVASSAAAAAGGIGSLVFLMNAPIAKITVATLVIGAAATGLILQQQQINRLNAENAALLKDVASLRKATPRPYVYKASSDASVATLESELARLRAQVEQMKTSPAQTWQDRVGQLRDILAQMPELGIPELQFATEEDWLDAAKEKLETLDDYRRALGKLRNLATARFTPLAFEALQAFIKANPGQQPTDTLQLQAYLGRPLDPALLQRYAVKPRSAVPNIGVGEWILTQKRVVDEEYDAQVAIGTRGMGTTNWGVGAFHAVFKAFRQANPGQSASNPEVLLPYATTPEEKEAVQRKIREAKKDGK